MRAAAVQFSPAFGNVRANLERIVRGISETDADLVVFPECALTGYAFDSATDAMRASETVPGPSSEAVAAACLKARRWSVFGMLERSGNVFFNSAVVAGPDGIAGAYRKSHLPFLGADRFASPGDTGFRVFAAPFGKFGVLICYDLSFPEAARVLKLDGAQLVCVPTNWPRQADVSCRLSPVVRAHENHVNVLTANRCGEEGGFRFRGESRIVDFHGRVLAEARAGEAVIVAELDLAGADVNRVVNIPGKYELDRISSRRPDLYGPISNVSPKRHVEI